MKKPMKNSTPGKPVSIANPIGEEAPTVIMSSPQQDLSIAPIMLERPAAAFTEKE